MQTADSLSALLRDYLSARLGAPVSISSLTPLIGGACQDNYALDLDVNGATGQYVLRTDKGRALDFSISRADEYHVIEAASAAGVRTPKPFLLESSPNVIGHPFYLMERIPGTAIARKLLTDESLAGARASLPGELAQNLARIHSVQPAAIPALPAPHPSAAEHAIRETYRAIDALPETFPAMELALRWLIAMQPKDGDLTLVHGDFRTGNFMVTPAGLSGILDWEFAHVGDPLEDLAWLCMRDWRFGRDDQPVGGIADRELFYRAYEAASGRKVDPARAHYWEIFGNLRWALGAAQQAQRHLSGADRSIELAAIGRRVPEMELEMLYLIERGPILRSE